LRTAPSENPPCNSRDFRKDCIFMLRRLLPSLRWLRVSTQYTPGVPDGSTPQMYSSAPLYGRAHHADVFLRQSILYDLPCL
jgi:hypothetical protein